MTASRLARENGLRLDGTDDAMAVISSGIGRCIFTLDDVSDEFFDLSNGVAGDVFQKLINYRCEIALVVPPGHGLGQRVEELAREHSRHPIVRFFKTVEDALDWEK
jgi:hypothetical protein